MIWTFKVGYYRVYQNIFKLASLILRFPEPELLTGSGSLRALPETIKARGVKNVLIVTDKMLMSLGLLDNLLSGLKESHIGYTIYDGVQPNPTIQNIEDARQKYIDNNCEGIIAFGGGSPMDCAKAAGARISNSRKSVRRMKGYFRVGKPLPPFFAIPTTAGTGSETTIAAVVTDPGTHEKFVIMDLGLVPKVAVLDPELTIKLPQHITSTTGMDALTHAIEAYIGRSGTKYTDENAEKAVKLIFENLEEVYRDGSSLEGRNAMALASFHGGIAFTRAYVGYVHAIAHTLGGLYGVPHGLANAVILPYILEYYGEIIEAKLAKLAVAGGIGKAEEGNKVLAKRFVDRVKEMNKNMNIPTYIKELKEQDISLIAKRALKEGNPDYPVPKVMNEEECKGILKKLLVS